MGSVRLPNKVLLEINGQSIIEAVVKRLEKSHRLNKIVVATGDAVSNAELVKHVETLGVNCFIGSENDVLKRFLDCAEFYDAKHVVRITADCPLVDGKIIDQLIDMYEKSGADYGSNTLPPTFPDGLDVEVFSIDTLRNCEENADQDTDREHVTSYIRRKFKNVVNLAHSADLSDIRLTLDEEADLILLKGLVPHNLSLSECDWKVFVDKLRSGKLASVNSGIPRNEGASMSTGQKLYTRAKAIIPGGTMLLSKRPEMFLPNKWPSYFQRASGCMIWDLDDNELLDMSIMGIGTNTLGYGCAEVDEAVHRAVRNGNLSTLNCPEEVWLAEELLKINRWAGGVRFARTGGEANAIAVRIARAAVGREGVAVCGYHGWHDWYLSANIGSDDELKRHLLPGLSTDGVPRSLAGTIYGFAYNDFSELENLVEARNIGVVKMEVQRSSMPTNNFLHKVRKLCDERGIVLIFDECTSGFRETYGGLFQKYDVIPDLAVFGKTIGNGYALTAVVGKNSVMEYAETTFISSTFWTERIGPSAALATLKVMKSVESWIKITEIGRQIKAFWSETANEAGFEIETWGLDPLAGFTVICEKPMHIKTYITQELLKKGILASNMVYASVAHEQRFLDRYFDEFSTIARQIPQIIEKNDFDRYLEGPVCHSGFARLN